jgi:hypothetical protein
MLRPALAARAAIAAAMLPVPMIVMSVMTLP